MGAMLRMQAIRQYQHAGINTAVPNASPHQLIAMLLEGAMDRVSRARGATRNGDRAARMGSITSAIAIVEYLRLCLDHNAGSLSQRLDSLYDFILRRLAQANASDNETLLEEVADVLRPIKDAWDAMPQTARVQ